MPPVPVDLFSGDPFALERRRRGSEVVADNLHDTLLENPGIVLVADLVAAAKARFHQHPSYVSTEGT